MSPSPEMTALYRREFDYDRAGRRPGLRARRPAASRRTPRRCAPSHVAAWASAPGQTAVLYAPTWRDTLATNFRAARLHDDLDVAELAAALGPTHVVLLRGHRFHARHPERPGGARIVDVTDHPEINHLVLAADVAVLDYSSLRFDVGVVGIADAVPGPRPGAYEEARAASSSTSAPPPPARCWPAPTRYRLAARPRPRSGPTTPRRTPSSASASTPARTAMLPTVRSRRSSGGARAGRTPESGELSWLRCPHTLGSPADSSRRPELAALAPDRVTPDVRRPLDRSAAALASASRTRRLRRPAGAAVGASCRATRLGRAGRAASARRAAARAVVRRRRGRGCAGCRGSRSTRQPEASSASACRSARSLTWSSAHAGRPGRRRRRGGGGSWSSASRRRDGPGRGSACRATPPRRTAG